MTDVIICLLLTLSMFFIPYKYILYGDLLFLSIAQLPFFEGPGGLKIAHSNAILRYLAHKGNLMGATDADRGVNEMLIEEQVDLFNLINKANYSTEKGKAYDELFAADGAFRKQVAFLEALIGAGSTFTSGDKRGAGEYSLAAVLDIARTLEPTILDEAPKIKSFTETLVASSAFDGIRDLGMYFARA